ncbi:hypothetical protein JAO76_11405 [Pontibacter sp. BT310]|uniref:DUF4760 domain-containing protein n=1 Tax=Pontibacter populi TaxID=890055 RepID=A0ABS6XDR2_9BACT|nr:MULTISPECIES: hypothetical protein [Pontibacter]MBJ6118804.1 hypothetical protein [Pontibacter sp. BT310]MBR0571232.1 hypothetical protein [Microvirga sp. STS03]MBW3365658.1 hypothetical protein [Pontibacter populi]
MKKNLIPMIAILPVGILAYMYNLISLLLLAVIAISLAVLLLAGIIKAFRSELNARWLRVPLLITAVCAAGIVIGLFRPLEPAVVNSGNVSDKLAYAYNTDQADRMTIRAYLGFLNDSMAKRDSIRLEQVGELYRNSQISKPMDKFYAAFIFHHSNHSSLFEIAQKLAGEAASESELKSDYVVQWLAKATYDRWMVSLGKPQKYGTQDKFSVSVE